MLKLSPDRIVATDFSLRFLISIVLNYIIYYYLLLIILLYYNYIKSIWLRKKFLFFTSVE